MKRFKLTINDLDMSKVCQGLSFSDPTNSIGRFDARLTGIKDIIGKETVKIYDDDRQVWQGIIGTPVKENTPGGEGMPIGGLEWTAKLQNYKTGYSNQTGKTLTEALTDLLTESPYGVGDLDELSETEAEMKVWNTSLEFLAFTFSDTCIVYATSVELEDEPDTTLNMEVPPPNRRWVFFDYSTGYFFIVAYDATNSLLKYNSTADYVIWKGWTSLGFNKGDNGNYGLAWDEANGLLYLIVDDGANLDFYEYTSAGGTLTQQDNDDNVDAGDLVCGPIVDNNSDVVFICNDGTNYCIWRFTVATNTWTREITWLVSSNDDPKYIFRSDTDDEDCIVIIFDDDGNDLEEWLYDHTGGTFARIRDIDTTVTTVGYVCGYQDASDNMFIVWEDSDLDYSEKTIGGTTWTTPVELVDTADYDTMGAFSLFGDYAQNLYLFYLKDDATLEIIRRFEESWEATVTLSSDADATTKVGSPENGYAGFIAWIDDNDDVNSLLLSPYALAVNKQFTDADVTHDYESGKDFDSQVVNAGCTLEASMDWASSGVQSIKSVTSGKAAGTQNSFGRYEPVNLDEVYDRQVIHVTEWGAVDNGDYTHFLQYWNGAGANISVAVGWEMVAGAAQWRLRLREGAVGVTYNAGAPVVDTDYCIEVYWLKDNAAGICQVWIDGVLTFNLSAKDTDNLGNITTKYYGLSSVGCQNQTTLYFDDVAWGDERIGCVLTGWFRTDSYTASGAMNNWGTLDSTNDDDNNTSWGAWTAVPVLIVDGLITAVDLEGAGVASTDDPLQIRADLTEGLSGSRTYVFDVRLNEKQGLIDYLYDFELSSTGAKKIADILGYEYKLRWTNLLDFKVTLGENKSDYIILKTAKSLSSYPDTIPNIVIINREPDFDSFANAVYVKGFGNYPSRADGEAQDAESQETYGVQWVTLTNKDCTSTGMSNTFARTEVNIRKTPTERIDVEFYDDYEAGDIQGGDTVRLVDEVTGLDRAARVILISYSEDRSGRKARASLVSNVKAKTFIEYIARIQDLARWA